MLLNLLLNSPYNFNLHQFQAREHLLKIITRNTDLLLDVEDCLLTAKTMKSFANRPETLSVQAKVKYKKIQDNKQTIIPL